MCLMSGVPCKVSRDRREVIKRRASDNGGQCHAMFRAYSSNRVHNHVSASEWLVPSSIHDKGCGSTWSYKCFEAFFFSFLSIKRERKKECSETLVAWSGAQPKSERRRWSGGHQATAEHPWGKYYSLHYKIHSWNVLYSLYIALIWINICLLQINVLQLRCCASCSGKYQIDFNCENLKAHPEKVSCSTITIIRESNRTTYLLHN